MAYIATNGAASYQTFPLFWDDVATLKGTCNLKVITVVSIRASANRKMHQEST